jgi:hypothetical protein
MPLQGEPVCAYFSSSLVAAVPSQQQPTYNIFAVSEKLRAAYYAYASHLATLKGVFLPF